MPINTVKTEGYGKAVETPVEGFQGEASRRFNIII